MAAQPGKPDITEPANRTRLAWTRTAIGFAAIGGAMIKFSPIAGIIVLAMTLPIWAVTRRTQRRAGSMSAASGRLVTATVVFIALTALVVAIFGHSPDSLGQLLRAH